MQHTTIAAIESLRTFAVANNEMEFAHLCTAALAGEEWAMERVQPALTVFHGTGNAQHHAQQAWSVIRDTDTTRPDGAVARSIKI